MALRIAAVQIAQALQDRARQWALLSPQHHILALAGYVNNPMQVLETRLVVHHFVGILLADTKKNTQVLSLITFASDHHSR